ncbi:MAG: hypothetical protein FJ293_13535 [Planctomycetes bacterium]|nr:hypothetical protein [Planctomycetota bacterium]
MKRFLKIVLILALFALGVGYVAFRIAIFDPFAGPRAALDPLVPKDVDFMVRRKGLAQDFGVFPLPRFFSALRLRDEWKEFAKTRVYREELPVAAIEQLFDELATLPEQLAPLDLMRDLAGRELLLCGRIRADGSYAWAVAARGSFRAKFFAEALTLGMVRAKVGVVEEWSETESVQSFTAQGQRWHLARADDALLAGNDFELVRDMRKLADQDALSLEDSPQYRAAVLAPSPVGRPLDFVVDIGKTMREFGLAPPPAGPDASPLAKLAAEVLVPQHFGPAMGRVALGNQLELGFRANLDHAALQPLLSGVLDGPTGDLAQAWEFCGRVFPARVALALHFKVDMRKLFRRAESLIDPDVRRILNEDFIPNLKFKTGLIQAKSLAELLEALAAVVGDEVVFGLEPNEAYQQPAAAGEDPVIQYPDPRHGPRLAFILSAADRDSSVRFVTTLVDALRARVHEVPRVYSWTYPQMDDIKFSELAFADPSLPPVAIGAVELMKRPCIVITTTGEFLNEICVQKMTSESGHNTGLMSELAFRQVKEAATGFGQGFAYSSSDRLRKVLEDLCVIYAEDETRPDWVKIRRTVEAEVIARRFPEVRGKTPDAKQQQAIDLVVDDEITAQERHWQDRVVPERTEAMKRDLGGLAVVRWAAAMLAIDERELSVRLRLAGPVPFGETLGE